jgi:N-acetylneuraminic acid mutarotase
VIDRRLLLAGLIALVAGAVIGITLSVSADGNGNEDETARDSLSSRWISLHPALLKRTEVAAVRIGRFIYVVGGFEEKSRSTTAAVERYDITRNRWKRVRSMPVPLNHPAAAAYRGDVYVLGGYTGRGDLRGETSSLFRYDPERNRWSRLPSAPTKRAALAAAVIGGKLYAAGGANSSAGALKTLEIYDFRRRRWSRGPDMSVAREHLAGTAAGGSFYVLAGRAAGQGNFTIAERYLPRERRWERLPDLRKARGGIAATSVGSRVVVFGGEELSGTIKEVEIYHPAQRRWTALPDLRTPRHGLGGVSRGRRVFAIEGGPSPGFAFSNAIEALDIARVRIAGE